ncbi:MAG: hypothetical protein WBB19_09570 [Desulforhopalus sp.]
MQSSTYNDIIEDKITEWHSSLTKLDKMVTKATSDSKNDLNAKITQLKSAIEVAKIQLYTLDKQETVGNTMETKDKILEIFNSIDKDFMGFEEKTPFML